MSSPAPTPLARLGSRIAPSHAQTLRAVAATEPATVMEVLDALGLPWSARGTVRNRLTALVEARHLIEDEGRPQRFALNQLAADPAEVDAP